MNGYIKRTDAIEALSKAFNVIPMPYALAEGILKDVPNAPVIELSKIVQCKECRFGEWRMSEVEHGVKGYMCGIRCLMDEHGFDGEGFCALGVRKDENNE